MNMMNGDPRMQALMNVMQQSQAPMMQQPMGATQLPQMPQGMGAPPNGMNAQANSASALLDQAVQALQAYLTMMDPASVNADMVAQIVQKLSMIKSMGAPASMPPMEPSAVSFEKPPQMPQIPPAM